VNIFKEFALEVMVIPRTSKGISLTMERGYRYSARKKHSAVCSAGGLNSPNQSSCWLRWTSFTLC